MITIRLNLTGENKNLRTENRTEKIKAYKEFLATFGEIWHIKIKNFFILNGRFASSLEYTAKNMPPPTLLKKRAARAH